MCQSSNFARNTTKKAFSERSPRDPWNTTVPGKTTETARFRVVLVHILERGCWRSLTEIDKLVGPIGATNEHETTTSYPTVIHANHSNAEHCSNKLSPRKHKLGKISMSKSYSVRRIASFLEKINSNLTANTAFTGYGSQMALKVRLRAAPGQ